MTACFGKVGSLQTHPLESFIDRSSSDECSIGFPEYSLHPNSNLVKAIHKVASACLKSHFYIELVAGGGTKGISGDPVYRVFSCSEKNLQGVVKVFYKEEKYLEELQGIQALEKLYQAGHFNRIRSSTGLVTVPAEGACACVNQKVSLLFQTAAQGDGLDDLICRYAWTIDVQEDLSIIFGKVYQTLDALHKIATTPHPEKTKESINHTIRAIKEMLGKLNKAPSLFVRGNSIHQLQERVDQLEEEVSQIGPLCGCIIHGDSHPGNIFVRISGEVTLIDLPSLYRSIIGYSELEEPICWQGIQLPERDLLNLYHRIWDVWMRSVYTAQEKLDVAAFDKMMSTVPIPKGPIADLQSLRSLLGTICKLVLPENKKMNRRYSLECLVDQKIARETMRKVQVVAGQTPIGFSVLPLIVKSVPSSFLFQAVENDKIIEFEDPSSLIVDYAFTSPSGDLIFSTRENVYLFSFKRKELIWSKSICHKQHTMVFPLSDKKIIYYDGEGIKLLDLPKRTPSFSFPKISINCFFQPLIRKEDFLVVVIKEEKNILYSFNFQLKAHLTQKKSFAVNFSVPQMPFDLL